MIKLHYFPTFQLLYGLRLAQTQIGGQALIKKVGQNAATEIVSSQDFGEVLRVRVGLALMEFTNLNRPNAVLPYLSTQAKKVTVKPLTGGAVSTSKLL